MIITDGRWLRGRRPVFATILALFFLAHVMPARQRRGFISSSRRRLNQDAALSAALDGLPVSPSAKSQATPAVNIYGLDPGLLAALQQSGANVTSGSRNNTAITAPAPGPSTSFSGSSSNGSSLGPPPGMVSSSSVSQTPAAWSGPGMAPGPSTSAPPPKGSQNAPAPGPGVPQQAAALPTPRNTYTPLDPRLAAALENQNRVPASPPAPSPSFAPVRNASANSSSISLMPAASPGALPPAYVSMGAPEASASPPQVQQDQIQGLCEDEAWQASSLKLLQERPFASLFPAELNDTVFDPTGLEQIDMNYYVVFKSSLTIAYIPTRLSPMDDSNKLVAVSSNINKTTFGGIAAKRDDGGFLAVQERRKSSSTGEELRPIIHELQVAPDLKSYSVLRHCAVAFNLSETITGFQDIQIHHDDKGNKWLLGLCTGNHCAGGEYGRERGNGRIVVSRMKEDGRGCAWVPQKVISIPATAAFSQFSGIAIRRNKMLIASQDDSAIWLGDIDWDAWEFTDQGKVFHLPRNDACQMTYCSVNAVQWLDDKRITVASGVAPPGSPWPCFSKAESLHQFLLPSSAANNANSAR